MAGKGQLDVRKVGVLTWDTPEHVRPTEDHVLLRVVPPPEAIGSVLIPNGVRADKGALWEADVVAVGPGRWCGHEHVPVDLKPGDRVLVRPNPGWELGELRMLREGAIEGELTP